CQQYTKLPYTF
nr:immunoglobulin light chain junction region [Mus musculus]